MFRRRKDLSAGRKSLISQVLGLIILFGLVLRVLYLIEIKDNPDFRHPGIDAAYHIYWARGLAGEGWEVPEGRDDPQVYRHPYFRSPGYAYFLAVIFRLTGSGPWWPRLVQMAQPQMRNETTQAIHHSMTGPRWRA